MKSKHSRLNSQRYINKRHSKEHPWREETRLGQQYTQLLLIKKRSNYWKVLLVAAVVVLIVAAAILSGCSFQKETSESSDSTSEIAIDKMDLEYTKRDKDSSYDESSATHISLNDTLAVVSGEGASTDGSTVTINSAGTYVITGNLSDGQLLIEAGDDDKVQIVLAGASIHNENGPAIYIKNADKTFISLAEGTENTLSDGTNYVLEDNSDEPHATLFSKDDLTINGAGSLTIEANYRHGICSKDDLVITGGSLAVVSVEDALRGRDCVKILDGSFVLQSGEDAIKSNNDEDGTKGFISLDGGVFDISAGDDAVHAESVLFVNDGTVNVSTCYEGYEAEQIYINGANTHIVASDDALNAAARSSSANEISATGNVKNTSSRDAINDTLANDNAPKKAIFSDEEVAGNEKNMDSDTAPSDNAMDRNANAASFNNNAGEKSGELSGTMNEAPDSGNNVSCLIQINGGYTVLDASGDGVDSNGSVEITGGVLLVSGPTSDGDGAFDYDNSATVSGGTVIMVGSAGMAQNFTSGTQAFSLDSISGSAGEAVVVCDSESNVLASFAPSKAYSTVLVSCPGFEDEASYQVVVGGSVEGANADGHVASGIVEGGTSTVITVSTTATSGMGGLGPDGQGLAAGQPGEAQRGRASSEMMTR